MHLFRLPSAGPLALLLALAAPAGAAAQASPAPPVFKAGASLVAVPVFVTDKSGHSVAGLTAADFELLDEGRPVPIAAFQAVDATAEAGPAGADVPPALQAVATRQFLLLFDLQFSPPGGLGRSRAEAARFVRQRLTPRDLVAVATFGRVGLRMLTPFTSDRARVTRAIETLGLVGAVAAGDPLGLGGGFEVAGNTGGEGNAAQADAEIAEQLSRMQVELKRAYRQRVLDFLGNMSDLARALTAWRGRKQVLLFSGGFDQSSWLEASRTGPLIRPPQPFGDESDVLPVRDLMQRMFRTLREADVVIHTVDVTGIPGTMDLTNQTGEHPTTLNGRPTLEALAVNTGGRAVRPTNDFARALQEVDETSRHYYVLAFQPAEGAGAKPRALKVRVRGSGLTLSHRAAYTVPPPAAAGGDADVRLVAAEAIAKGLSGGALRLELLALPYRDPRGGLSVPAVLRVDGAALAAAATGTEAKVQVYGYALARQQVVDALLLETTLDLGRVGPALRAHDLRVLTSFAVPAAGPVELRFFVRAGTQGASGSVRGAVEVPSFTAAEAVVPAPMLTLPVAGTLALPFTTQRGAALTLPFRLGDEPFVPEAVRLRPGQPREVCLMAWHVAQGALGAPSTVPPEVAAEIAGAGGAALAVRIESPRLVSDPDGFERYLVTLVAPPAPPGDYALRLTVKDPASGRTARSESQIVVE